MWWSYNTPYLRFLSVATLWTSTTTEKPVCLSTSCTFSTIKPPSNLTLPGSCLCSWLCCFDWDPGEDHRADGCEQRMLLKSSWTKFHGIKICLSQRLTQWQLLKSSTTFRVLNLSLFSSLMVFSLWSVSKFSRLEAAPSKTQILFHVKAEKKQAAGERKTLCSRTWFLCSLTESSEFEYELPSLQQAPLLPWLWSTSLLTGFTPDRSAFAQLLVTQNTVNSTDVWQLCLCILCVPLIP